MITLLSDIENTDGAEMTFRMVKEQIRAARRSIEIHMFSMQKAEELNVVIQNDAALMEQFRKTITHRIAAAHDVVSVDEFSTYNKRIAYLQQMHQKLNDLFN